MEPVFRTQEGTDDAGLRVVGELDLSARGTLGTVLAELSARDVGRLWLDLAGVTFIDCGCMGEVDRWRRHVAAAGRRFDVTAVSTVVLSVAELARYDELAALARAARGT